MVTFAAIWCISLRLSTSTSALFRQRRVFPLAGLRNRLRPRLAPASALRRHHQPHPRHHHPKSYTLLRPQTTTSAAFSTRRRPHRLLRRPAPRNLLHTLSHTGSDTRTRAHTGSRASSCPARTTRPVAGRQPRGLSGPVDPVQGLSLQRGERLLHLLPAPLAVGGRRRRALWPVAERLAREGDQLAMPDVWQ